jgi:aminotransferase
MTLELSKKLSDIRPSGIREFFDLVIGQKDIISLGVGEPDFSSPWPIRQAAIESLEKGLTTYTSNKGLYSLRKRISFYIDNKYNAKYDPESEILITNGVSEGIDIILRALINPDDEIIVPEPNYICYTPLVELCHGKAISINTRHTEFIPTITDISKAITEKTKAIILCSPNNPTGAVIPKETIIEISKLAKKHGFWIISDEIYAELTYNRNHTSLCEINDVKDRTIIVSGFSKTFAMTGFRVGYILAPEGMVSQSLKIHQYSALCAPITSQIAAERALDCDDEVKKMKESYAIRRNILVNKIKKMGLSMAPTHGAFYGFINIEPLHLSSKDTALLLLKEKKIAVVPGHVFGKGGEGFVRCCYAVTTTQLIEALNRLEMFVNERKIK